MKNCLGIVGGVGPFASAYLYEMITKRTKASKDQDHLDIIIFSHASIPDRTAYILGQSDENPFGYLLDDCKKLEELGALMISIPCNTSCYFSEELSKSTSVPVSNIVHNTVKYLAENGYKNVGIMATSGTIASRLYQDKLDSYGISYCVVDGDKVMEIIYDYVKSGKDVPLSLWNEITDGYSVDGFILGCTELSILKGKMNLDDRFIDPLEIETDNILKFFNKN